MASAGISTKSVVVRLSVLPSEAIKAIEDARTKIEQLTKAQETLERVGYKNSALWIRNEAEIKNLNTVISQNQKLLQDSINQQKANGDSLNALRAQLAALLKQYDDLSKAERESAQGQDMLNHIKSLTEEIKGLEEGTKRFGRSVGSYEDAIAAAINGTLPMKQAMRQIKEELTQLEVKYRESAGIIQGQQQVIDNIAATQGKESQAYQDAVAEMDNLMQKRAEMKEQIDEMTEKAGELNDAITDVNESIKNAGTDYAPLVAAKQSADLLVNSYTALHGTLVALGIEDKNLIEIYAKLQIVQKGLNAMTQVYNLLQKESVLRQQLSVLWTTLTTKSLGSLIAAKRGDAVASVTATAATGALAAGEGVATTTSWTLVGALKAVSAAIMSIPLIGWILAIIAALTTLIGLIISANKEEDLGNKIADEIIAKDQERLNTLKEIEREQKQVADRIREQAKELQTLNKDTRQYKDNLKDVASYLGVSAEYVEKHPEQIQKAIEAQEELNELQAKMEENQKASNEHEKEKAELIADSQAAMASGWDSSNQQLQKMVDNGKITEDQMKRIQKLRKQYNKGNISAYERDRQLNTILYEQINAHDKIISKVNSENSSLKVQLDLQRGIVDEIQTASDAEEKSEEERKKAAEAAKERRRNELNERRKLEDMELQMVKDGIEKQIEQYRLQMKRQIEDLKERLKTEKNLSKKAREDINSQIAILTAKQLNDEWKLRQKYNDDGIKSQLDFWKRYYKSIEDTMPLETNKGLEARLQTLKMTYEATVKEVQKSMEPINKKYIEWTEMSEKSGKEREQMLSKLGMTEEQFSSKLSQVILEWDAANKAYGETLNNLELGYNQATTRMEMQAEESARKIKSETAQIYTDNFYTDTLNQIELGAYADKEIQKTQILKDQASARLFTAQDEMKRLQSLSQEEIIALYGTQEQYELAVAQSSQKVIEAQNNLSVAMKNVNVAVANQRKTLMDSGLAVAKSMEETAGAINSLFNTLAENNEKYSDFATAMALAQIMISTAISIAQAIQGAMTAAAQTGIAAPFTAPAFIAEMVAIVAGSIASAVSTLQQAKQAKSAAGTPRFATGGLITEGGDRTGTKDNVHIMASTGEYIIKKKAVDNVGVDFLDMINNFDGKSRTAKSGYYAAGGEITTAISTSIESSSFDKMKASFTEALQEMPNPVVSVKEITRTQDRVRTKEQLSKM